MDQPSVAPRRARASVAACLAALLLLPLSACGGDADAERVAVEIEPLDTPTSAPLARAAKAPSSTVLPPSPTLAPPPTETPAPAPPTEFPAPPAPPTTEPEAAAAASEGGTTPTHTPPFAPAATGTLDGVRVYANGDSTSYFMSVAVLQAAVALGAIQVQPAPEYQISSGLSNPTYFDWYGYLAADMAAYDPGLVVFMVGANDAHPAIDLDAYRQRVATLMDQLNGRRLIWVGQPNMSRTDLAVAIPGMNQVFLEEASKRPWVTYVDTWALTSDPAGAFTPYMTDATGAVILGRADDGVHFTSAGGAILGQAVLAAITGS